MGEIKWVKLSVDMFNNRKIRQIEGMPEGNGILLTWIKMICLAGSINDNGSIYLTKEIPYTDDTLAREFGQPLNTIRLALETFSRFSMIEVVDDFIKLSNWAEYQNVDGMEKARQAHRERQKRYREEQKSKQLDVPKDKKTVTGDVTRDVTVTSRVTDSSLSLSISNSLSRSNSLSSNKSNTSNNNILNNNILNNNKTKNNTKNNTKEKHKYGEYKNVLLSDEEIEKLKKEFPDDWRARIENVSGYVAQTGKTYKNYLATIRNWARREKAAKAGADSSYERAVDYCGEVGVIL